MIQVNLTTLPRAAYRQWTVYALKMSSDSNGRVMYVGKTRNTKRRLKEHRQDRDAPIFMHILETGEDAGTCNASEKKWISHYRALGQCEWNIANGGNGPDMVTESTRALLSALGKGKPKPPGFAEKISKAHKGRKKEFTAEGLARATTRFKPGVNSFDLLTEEAKERKREAARRNWDNISPEERTRRAVERNRVMWANRNPEKRAEIGQKILAGQLKNQSLEEIQARARRNGAKAAEKPGVKEASSKSLKAWWASLTPEATRDFIDRRAPKIAATRIAKKLAREAAKVAESKQ